MQGWLEIHGQLFKPAFLVQTNKVMWPKTTRCVKEFSVIYEIIIITHVQMFIMEIWSFNDTKVSLLINNPKVKVN